MPGNNRETAAGGASPSVGPVLRDDGIIEDPQFRRLFGDLAFAVNYKTMTMDTDDIKTHSRRFRAIDTLLKTYREGLADDGPGEAGRE